MRVLAVAVAVASWAAVAPAQQDLPVVEATRPVVSVRVGDTLYKDSWQLAPETKPDVYEADLVNGMSQPVAFITDVDSIRFEVEENRSYDFIIRHGSDRCLTRIVGRRFIPAAVFDAEYQAAHRGRISVLAPEVYELVNVAIAMTPTGLANRNLVYHDSDYYAAMRNWFDPYRDDPVLGALDSVLLHSIYLYANLKMNGYAFEFDRDGRIVQSRIYDRTAFPSERRNSLRPFLGQLQSFADRSKFRAFYAQHKPTYAAQVAFYADTADVEAMRAWLDRNFPGSSGYDSYKVIFSPLVAYNQSATWMESNGFRELQAHVNYPYAQDVPRRTGGVALSREAETILRGDIVFTELNHGYINPEADRYAERVLRAISRRDLWVDPVHGPGYYGGISLFNEYMNWGLVSLRVIDTVPPGEQQTLITTVDDMMTKARGFPRFREFDTFLVGLYRRRKAGQTVADLYPAIIEWFEKQNAAAGQTVPDRP